jgi:hypothetical protein
MDGIHMLDLIDDLLGLIRKLFLFIFSWKVLVVLAGFALLYVLYNVLENQRSYKKEVQKNPAKMKKQEEMEKTRSSLELKAEFSTQGRYDYAKWLRKNDPKAFKNYVSECVNKNEKGAFVMQSWQRMDQYGDLDYRETWKYAKKAVQAHEPEANEQLELIKDKVTQKIDSIAAYQKKMEEEKLPEARRFYAAKEWKKLKEYTKPLIQTFLNERAYLNYWCKEIGVQNKISFEEWFNLSGTALMLGTTWKNAPVRSSEAEIALACFDRSKSDGSFDNRYARLMAKSIYFNENRIKNLDWDEVSQTLSEAREKDAPYFSHIQKVLNAWTFDDAASETEEKEMKPKSVKVKRLTDMQQRDLDMMLGGTGKSLEEKLFSGEMSYSDYLDWDELNTKVETQWQED